MCLHSWIFIIVGKFSFSLTRCPLHCTVGLDNFRRRTTMNEAQSHIKWLKRNLKCLDALRGSSPARVLGWYMLAEVDTLCNPIKIGLWKGPDTRSKCVVTMNPTQAGQSRAVGTRFVHPGPSEDLQGPKKGLSGPKRALFACFLELGGSIWAITVLNEPGIPLRCSGHPTSLCSEKKIVPHKIGPWNFRYQGQIALF